jgi:hypothetical protein
MLSLLPQMHNNQLALIAVVAALGLLGIVVLTVTVTIPIQQQQAEAAKSATGLCASTLKNVSASSCH